MKIILIMASCWRVLLVGILVFQFSSSYGDTTKARFFCGMPDDVHGTIVHQGSFHHEDGSLLFGTLYAFFNQSGRPLKWPIDHADDMTYAIRTTGNIPLEDLRTAISNAFSTWESHSVFIFREADPDESADIEIGVYSGFHGDYTSFDGKGGIFAHGSKPTEGILHFDDSEDWSINPGRFQVDLESVALHEIGHILGLGHSDNNAAVMGRYFSYGRTKRSLLDDDMKGIQMLYQ